MHARRRLSILMLTAGTLFGIVGLAGGWFGPSETTITELAPGVFFRKTQTQPEFIGCNQGWVVFKDFVLVIDANFPNQAEKVIAHIRETTDKPIRYVFDTHYHGDHADGNQQYTRDGAIAVASENSKTLFETKGIAGFRQSQKTRPGENRNPVAVLQGVDGGRCERADREHRARVRGVGGSEVGRLRRFGTGGEAPVLLPGDTGSP